MIRRLAPGWMRCSQALLILGALLASAATQAAVQVIVTGLGSDERGNVEARLSIRERALDPTLDDGLVLRLHQRAPEEISEAMRPFGWYAPTVEAELSGTAPNWTARYHVIAGPYVRVSKVDLAVEGEGTGFEVIHRAIRRMPLRLDQRLKHTDYETSKAEVLSAAYNGGYLDAQWTRHELRVDPARLTAEALLTLDTGPRYYFGDIRIEQEGLDPAFIGRYLSLKPGEPFLSERVLEQQFTLSDLDYFDTVELDPQRAETTADHRIPLVVRTTPRNRRRYDLGLGYGTDTGARLSLATEWRRINSQGHKIFTDVRLSEIQDAATAEYRIPLGNRPAESLSFTATEARETLSDGETSSWGLGAAVNRVSAKWQRKTYLQYLHESTDFGSESARANLLMPGVAFTRTESDDPVRARRGWYLTADLHGAESAALSSASLVQVHALGRAAYTPMRRTRILGRAEWGASLVREFDELPASQRFFAGGDQSVRGYDYQSLAPRNAAGEVVGGKYLTVYSIEGEYRLWGDWAAALFVDAGGADDQPVPKLYRGVGVGARYRIPIGDLRLDFAHPLDGDGQGIMLHFGVRVGL